MFGLSFGQLLVIGVVALLLFGSNLPEVARTLGQHYFKLRRSMSDLQRQFYEVEQDVTSPMRSIQSSLDDDIGGEDDWDGNDTPAAPRFTPPSQKRS
ncbi:MAG: twin-arginine translocase TatA/TatE family subunit [Planctomycetota bacterium]